MADIVQEIKLRTDLVELISTYVPLRRAGRAHKGLCPFHAEKSPSFTVDGERGFFKCYGCGVGGDCFTFVEKREGVDFQTAGEMLARRLGLEWRIRGETTETRSERQRLYDVNALAERFFRQSLERAPDVRQYLEKRGLTDGTIEDFHLGYAPGGYEALLRWLKQQKVSLEDADRAGVLVQGEHGLRDRFVDRVIFPILDLEGRVISFGGRTLRADGIPKYLNGPETSIFKKDRTLYGLFQAKKSIPELGFAVVVEGYMDLIALHQAGVSNAVASMGTAFTATNIGVLRRYVGEHGHMVMCYDGDSAGMNAVERSAGDFEAAGVEVRVASLPQGDDPDTYIKENGADAFRALLNRAEPLLDYQLNSLRRKFDLHDSTQRLPFVREAARAIARSGSHLTRQEYTAKLSRVLERLSDEWYPGEPHRAMQARVALTQEVSRLLRTDRVDARAGRMGQAPPAAAPAAARPSAQTLAERYVLRAALTEYRWADEVTERVTPAYFSDGALAGIAEALLGQNGEGDGLAPAERAKLVRDDPAKAEVLSALLLDETPLTDEGVAECLESLERSWQMRRRDELLRLFAAGELESGDPRLEELRSLNAEMSGSQRREDE